MKTLLANFKGLYTQLFLAPLFKLFEAILELIVPLIMANIIDVGILNRDTQYIWTRGLFMLLLGAFGCVFGMVCQYYSALVSGKFALKTRENLYHHILQLSPKDVAPIGTSGMITRLTNDTNQVQNAINMAMRLGTRVPFLLIGSIVMAFVLNWKMGIVFLITTIVISLILYIITKKTLPIYTDVQSKQDTLSMMGTENLSGVRVIRAFSRQNQEISDFNHESKSLSKLIIYVGKISSLLNPLTTAIVNIGIIFIIWFGASFVNMGSMQPGIIIALINYMNQVLMALTLAVNLIILFTRGFASAKRIEQALDLKPSIVDGIAPSNTIENFNIADCIEFEHVTFNYSKDAQPAIKDVSFKIKKNSTIGIISGTGSGKTTIINLILRHFDTTQGNIKIDDMPIKTYPLHTLRQKFGIVPQRAVLFNGTIRKNMQISAPDATDEMIWKALKMAQAEDFVKDLANQLDYVIEENGKNLSGGQKQRLTIARALVRNPQILILDDSFSALDYATDFALRKNLKQDTHKMTTIMVSQRVSTIKDLEQILVLDNGELVGNGTHQDLIQNCSVYAEICSSQNIDIVKEGGVL